MNIHHLELFYFVAKHKGVSAAARHMPYGIQQPAISAQILQLEDSLRVTLFQRRPFKLTREGAELFAHIEPFFNGLGPLEDRLRGGVDSRVRIAAPELVQGDYLPLILGQIRKHLPDFQFTLTGARLSEMEHLLTEQEVDIGLSTLGGRCPEGLQMRELLQLPMVLLVQADSPHTSVDSILNQDRIADALITLPSTEPVCRLFQAELQRRKVSWFPTHELGNLDLVHRYVGEGYGMGLSLAAPARRWPKSVRPLVLPGFPTITFAAFWMGKLGPSGEAFLKEVSALAQSLEQLES